MKKIKIFKVWDGARNYSYAVSDEIISVAGIDWWEVDDQKFEELRETILDANKANNYRKRRNQTNYNYIMVEKCEDGIEQEIYDSAQEYLDGQKAEKEKWLKQQEAEKRRKEKAKQERKRKQLEKLKKELGAD
jgi:hypothetical protein